LNRLKATIPRAVEGFAAMTELRDPVPLGQHRARVAQYLRGIAFPPGSVAASIIDERRPGRDDRDALRPSLVLWSCDAGFGNLADALPVSASFDLFDRFLILHDELAGDCAPSVLRWGLGQSLNAGDALYALAFRSLAHDASEPERRLRTARLVAEAVLDAIEERDEVVRNAVLTRAALGAGAVIAGAQEPAVEAYAHAGWLLETDPPAAASALRAFAPPNALADFEEVARYVARRAS
jgi:hypothetical protein